MLVFLSIFSSLPRQRCFGDVGHGREECAAGSRKRGASLFVTVLCQIYLKALELLCFAFAVGAELRPDQNCHHNRPVLCRIFAHWVLCAVSEQGVMTGAWNQLCGQFCKTPSNSCDRMSARQVSSTVEAIRCAVWLKTIENFAQCWCLAHGRGSST